MAGRDYGTVMKAGAANMARSGMTHRGPSQKNIVSGGRREANPSSGQTVRITRHIDGRGIRGRT